MTRKKPLGVGLSKEERMVLVIGEIIQELIKSHEDGKDVNLNRMKSRISAKYGLESSPRLVDIIAAVPHEAKKFLLPKLKAKPIRTASGVSSGCFSYWMLLSLVLLLDRSRCCHVQASSMSSYKLHGKYLCLLSWWSR